MEKRGGEGALDASISEPLSDTDTEDGTDALGLDSVAPPDGFPRPDGASCPAESPCELDLSEPCYEGRCNSLGECVPVRIPGCCETDEECADLIPLTACDRGLCLEGSCVLETEPGCCSLPSDCDDGESCTQDVCLKGPGGVCSHCPTGCDCPAQAPLFEAGFDTASLITEGFGINDAQSDSVSWRLSTRRAVSPPHAAWLGHDKCPTYFAGVLDAQCQPSAEGPLTGGTVSAELVGPAMSLTPSPGGYVASFWLWAAVEALGSGGSDERDVLRVWVQDLATNASVEVTSSLDIGKSTQGGWRRVAVDLSPWTEETIRLRFSFDTLDGQDNHHEGIYLDDISVIPRCATGCCEVDADCAQASASDPCVRTQCVAMTSGGQGTCMTLPKSPGLPCTPCTSDASCQDDNPCTEDLCTEDGVCQHSAFCCLEVSSYSTGFEEGLIDWYVSDDQPEDGVTWLTSDHSASEGSLSAWLGDPLSGTYEGTGAVSASLQTPHIALMESDEGEGEAAVRFYLNLSTEWDGYPYDNPGGIDRLSLDLIAADEEVIELWSSDAVGGSTQGQWVEVVVSLSPWASQSIQLRFSFDTVDGDRNDYAGPRIDDLRVGQVCP